MDEKENRVLIVSAVGVVAVVLVLIFIFGGKRKKAAAVGTPTITTAGLPANTVVTVAIPGTPAGQAAADASSTPVVLPETAPPASAPADAPAPSSYLSVQQTPARAGEAWQRFAQLAQNPGLIPGRTISFDMGIPAGAIRGGISGNRMVRLLPTRRFTNAASGDAYGLHPLSVQTA